jgi:23S rRNA (cytidine2498-2'-O)-methyltransferase
MASVGRGSLCHRFSLNIHDANRKRSDTEKSWFVRPRTLKTLLLPGPTGKRVSIRRTDKDGAVSSDHITAYLAAEGFERQLADELRLAGAVVTSRHDRLLVTDGPAVASAWSANTWFNAELIEVESIGDAARVLKARQRNWVAYAPQHHGRAQLIVDKLPHVSAKPLPFGTPAPTAPLGSFTLLTPNLLLAAGSCSSPFPNGEARFEEDREGPPNRAYQKLWEALALLRRFPTAGERCIDLGASPGGWTWSLAQLGATVLAVDKAPLDPKIDRLRNVTWLGESAFGLDPAAHRADWLFSDIIAYPTRLLALVERWIAAGTVANIVCTIKLQGDTDHDTVRAFQAIAGGRVLHLHQNKHELTLLWSRA